ncbi:hypothetical protein [Pedobacter sp. R-06]|uniref:hypothetical protein n=1 Tax=Pedobacter sp. R-06 TaxID=3404051 RepID=UPI003CF3ECBB
MKNLNTYVLKIAIVAVLSITSLTGCKREVNVPKLEVNNKLDATQKNRLIKYLAISMSVGINEIVYDENKCEFTVRGGAYKVSRKDLELSYSYANEYKFVNEK